VIAAKWGYTPLPPGVFASFSKQMGYGRPSVIVVKGKEIEEVDEVVEKASNASEIAARGIPPLFSRILQKTGYLRF